MLISPPIQTKSPGRTLRRFAFTILEVLIALFIFSMILTAIYSIWVGILRGRKAVETTLAEVQRSRIAMHALEDAFLTVQLFNDNVRHYAFQADTTGDDAYVSMVSRLPASFPGVGHFAGGDLVVRRVSFFTEPGEHGKQLVMTQAPMLMPPGDTDTEPYSIVLARDVTQFSLQFWDSQKNQWAEEWLYTNQLPRMVHITLGLGKTKGASSSSDSHDLVARIVSIPAIAVGGVQGMPRPGMNQPPGTGGTLNPVQNPYGQSPFGQQRGNSRSIPIQR